MTSVFRGTVPLVVASGSAQLATAASLAFAARDGSPASFAVLTGGMGAVTISSNFIDFGNNAWTIRETAAGRVTGAEFLPLVRTKTLLALVLALALPLLASLLPLSAPPMLELGLGSMLVLRVLITSYSSLLVGKGRFGSSGAVLASERVIGLIVLLVGRGAGLNASESLPLALSCGSLAALAFALFRWVTPDMRLSPGPVAAPRLLWKRSRSFGAQSVATDALLLDAWIISAVASPATAGLVALASRLTAPAGMVGQALSTVTLSLRSRQPQASGRGEVLAVLGMAGVMALVAGSSGKWLPAFFGAEYSGAVVPFMLYCASATLTVVNQVFSSRLQAMHRERAVALVVVPGALSALVLMAVGAFMAGAPGAAGGVLAANMGITLALGAGSRRRSGYVKGVESA